MIPIWLIIVIYLIIVETLFIFWIHNDMEFFFLKKIGALLLPILVLGIIIAIGNVFRLLINHIKQHPTEWIISGSVIGGLIVFFVMNYYIGRLLNIK